MEELERHLVIPKGKVEYATQYRMYCEKCGGERWDNPRLVADKEVDEKVEDFVYQRDCTRCGAPIVGKLQLYQKWEPKPYEPYEEDSYIDELKIALKDLWVICTDEQYGITFWSWERWEKRLEDLGINPKCSDEEIERGWNWYIDKDCANGANTTKD